MEEKYRIDPELNAVLPNLSEEDYSSLGLGCQKVTF